METYKSPNKILTTILPQLSVSVSLTYRSPQRMMNLLVPQGVDHRIEKRGDHSIELGKDLGGELGAAYKTMRVPRKQTPPPGGRTGGESLPPLGPGRDSEHSYHSPGRGCQNQPEGDSEADHRENECCHLGHTGIRAGQAHQGHEVTVKAVNVVGATEPQLAH